MRKMIVRLAVGVLVVFMVLVGMVGGPMSRQFVYANATTVGDPATNRASGMSDGLTVINLGNPASADFTAVTIEVYVLAQLSNCEVSSFYGSGSTWTVRDNEVLGTVATGKQTYNVNLTVNSGDCIGFYYTAGNLDAATSGGSGIRYKSGEYIDVNDTSTTWSLASGYVTSCQAIAASVVSPSITISAATTVTGSTATLPGNVTATGGEDPHVTVYWGDDDAGTTAGSWDSNSDPTSPAQHQGVAGFYKDVTGLTKNTQYFWRAAATNSAGTTWAAATLNFTTDTEPSITTSAATGIDGTAATLPGEVTSLGGDADCHVTVYWGTSDGTDNATAWGSSSDPTTPAQHQGAATFSKSLTALELNTKYYFRAAATNAVGTTWAASTRDFTTLNVATITQAAATLISATGARLPGEVTNLGGAVSCTFTVYYGDNDALDNATAWDNFTAPTSPVQPQGVATNYADIRGLSDATQYYFRVKGVTSIGTSWSTGTLNFTTLVGSGGPAGADGGDGADGADGVDGADGAPGSAGTSWSWESLWEGTTMYMLLLCLGSVVFLVMSTGRRGALWALVSALCSIGFILVAAGEDMAWLQIVAAVILGLGILSLIRGAVRGRA
jgi:hypothetical protein